MDYKEKYLKYKKKYTELKNSLYGGNQKQEQEQQQNIEINNALSTAIKKNNIEEVRELLDRGANVNNINNRNQTPLIIAASNFIYNDERKEKYINLINILIKNGADINYTDSRGNSALNYAIQREIEEVVRDLLERGVNVNNINNSNQTPLIIAASKKIYNTKERLNNKNIINILLEKGVNINIDHRDNEHNTALNYAVENNKIEVVGDLLERGANVNNINNNNQTPLIIAALKNFYNIENKLINENIINILLEEGVDINHQDNENNTALKYAMENGKIEVVNNLLDRNASIDERLIENFFIDAINSDNRTGIIKLLLDRRLVEYNFQRYNNPRINYDHFYTFIKNGIIDIVRLFLDSDADPNYNRPFRPIFYAIESNNLELVKLLIKKGASHKSVRNDGEMLTPLKLAVMRNHGSIVRFLINYDKKLLDNADSQVKKYIERIQAIDEIIDKTNLPEDMINYIKDFLY